MIIRAAAVLAILCLGVPLAVAARARAQGGSHKTSHATAKVTVQSSEATPYDQSAAPELAQISIREAFSGDIDGESEVRALQVRRADGSASMVSVQRVRGKLGGRQGASEVAM